MTDRTAILETLAHADAAHWNNTKIGGSLT